MIDWILENREGIFAAVFAAHALALAIVNLTPTPKDNEWVGSAYRWVERLAGLITKQSKK